MNIPEEVKLEALRATARDGWMIGKIDPALQVVAEWARTQALTEAAEVAEADLFFDDRGDVLSSDEVAYNTARREAATAVRALITEGGTDA